MDPHTAVGVAAAEQSPFSHVICLATAHPAKFGEAPGSIDFPLVQQTEPDRFEALFLGDPQPRNVEEVNYLAHDVLAEMVGTNAGFAVVLGDISFDNKETYLPYIQATGRVGVPFYNTAGNHDANYDGLDTYEHYDTWRTVFGPRYYSFDYGPVHFMVLSDVLFPEQGTSYVTGKYLLERTLADYGKQLEESGEDFQLRNFFDRLSDIDSIPISLARWEMTGLGEDIQSMLQNSRRLP